MTRLGAAWARAGCGMCGFLFSSPPPIEPPMPVSPVWVEIAPTAVLKNLHITTQPSGQRELSVVYVGVVWKATWLAWEGGGRRSRLTLAVCSCKISSATSSRLN